MNVQLPRHSRFVYQCLAWISVASVFGVFRQYWFGCRTRRARIGCLSLMGFSQLIPLIGVGSLCLKAVGGLRYWAVSTDLVSFQHCQQYFASSEHCWFVVTLSAAYFWSVKLSREVVADDCRDLTVQIQNWWILDLAGFVSRLNFTNFDVYVAKGFAAVGQKISLFGLRWKKFMGQWLQINLVMESYPCVSSEIPPWKLFNWIDHFLTKLASQ